jgi:hypothetical protein
MSLCALITVLGSASHPATIIKLNLGSSEAPDVEMTAAGEYRTVPVDAADPLNLTTGNQNTDVEYTGILDWIPDIQMKIASFTISGVNKDGLASNFGNHFIQNFMGGSFQLYGPAPVNELLLDTTLTESSLFGFLPTATGSYFNTTLGVATAGTLKDYILPGTVQIQMQLADVNGGSSFLLMGGNNLQPFSADSSGIIGADPIPEPTSALLLALTAFVSAISIRHGRRS